MQKPTITLGKPAKRSTLSLKPGARRKPKQKQIPAPHAPASPTKAEKLNAARKYLATSPTWSSCLPMAVGIHKEILASRPGCVPHKLIRLLIARRVNHKNYLAKTVPGAERYNWQGEPAGTVTEAEAEYARQKLQAKKPGGAA
jgi:hypothetical protein